MTRFAATAETRKTQAAIPAATGRLTTRVKPVSVGSGGTRKCAAYGIRSGRRFGIPAGSAQNESAAKAWFEFDSDEAKTIGGRAEVSGIW
jgi:hypothetical protein